MVAIGLMYMAWLYPHGGSPRGAFLDLVALTGKCCREGWISEFFVAAAAGPQRAREESASMGTRYEGLLQDELTEEYQQIKAIGGELRRVGRTEKCEATKKARERFTVGSSSGKKSGSSTNRKLTGEEE